MRVIGYLESSFWSMRQQEFAAMMRVAYAHASELDGYLTDTERIKPEAMLARSGERLAGTRYVEMRGNVAVIDLNGMIAKRMDMFDEICFGGTSTEKLLKDFTTAVSSPNVESIVFNIDSPGGEAFGINELAQAIYDARGKKPIKAYISGLGCSGAYWIAVAADEIIVDKSAFVGSIGVVTAWMDDKGFYEQMGIRKEVVTSTNAPLKRLDFDKPEHREELQRELDSIENVFHKFVAKGRKVSVDQVISDFNQGGVLLGAEAVKAGMADRTGSLEEVIRELSRKQKTTAAANAEGDIDMGFKEDFRALGVKFGLLDEKEIVAEGGEKPDDQADGHQEPNTAPEPEKTPVEKPDDEQEPNTDKEPEAAIKLKLEVDTSDTEATIAAMQKQVINTQATAFVDAELKAGRIFPAEKETFKSLYVQAALDDAANPLAEGSRVDTLKANQQARKPHGLTDELIDAEANKVLFAGGDKPTAERKAELLGKTHLGRSTLKGIDGGKSATAAAR